MAQIKIVLGRASDDPQENDPKYLEELAEFSKSLRTAGLDYSQRSMAFDAADAVGYPLGEYLVTFTKVAGPILGVILVTWLKGRSGRKVSLKIGDVKAEAQTKEEIDQLLESAKKFQQQSSADDKRRS
jgi:hypothetical protein